MSKNVINFIKCLFSIFSDAEMISMIGTETSKSSPAAMDDRCYLQLTTEKLDMNKRSSRNYTTTLPTLNLDGFTLSYRQIHLKSLVLIILITINNLVTPSLAYQLIPEATGHDSTQKVFRRQVDSALFVQKEQSVSHYSNLPDDEGSLVRLRRQANITSDRPERQSESCEVANIKCALRTGCGMALQVILYNVIYLNFTYDLGSI